MRWSLTDTLASQIHPADAGALIARLIQVAMQCTAPLAVGYLAGRFWCFTDNVPLSLFLWCVGQGFVFVFNQFCVLRWASYMVFWFDAEFLDDPEERRAGDLASCPT